MLRAWEVLFVSRLRHGRMSLLWCIWARRSFVGEGRGGRGREHDGRETDGLVQTWSTRRTGLTGFEWRGVTARFCVRGRQGCGRGAQCLPSRAGVGLLHSNGPPRCHIRGLYLPPPMPCLPSHLVTIAPHQEPHNKTNQSQDQGASPYDVTPLHSCCCCCCWPLAWVSVCCRARDEFALSSQSGCWHTTSRLPCSRVTSLCVCVYGWMEWC